MLLLNFLKLEEKNLYFSAVFKSMSATGTETYFVTVSVKHKTGSVQNWMEAVSLFFFVFLYNFF